ncbi:MULTISPECIES: glycosyltransferase family 2 protein [Dictyoglomus]|jgi:glycosyltransferase involved in cell wall biosynthesis|uniref:glycosyltransferase family 2 protein n=1 Tax=Dictyoglomus TaxID=13 RepID=UPI000CCF4394|nr:glycosyltransferase family 2 protein [Dictyoglomus turgidum]PNV79350.1 MAG: glycosyl transferase family 2 [Dictyoglomus turgidum]
MDISVVIPTYNRKKILEITLPNILNQDFEGEYEIIVSDDGSEDETSSYIKELQGKYKNLKYIKNNERKGPAYARNRAIEIAKGKLMVFIDSDIFVKKDFLKNHFEIQKKNNFNILVQGPVINTYNWEKPWEEKFKLRDISSAYFATGNASIPKEILLKAGFFDENFTFYGWEDLELGIRIKKLNIPKITSEKVTVWHIQTPPNLKNLPYLLNKEKERAKSALYFYKKHPILEVKMMIQLGKIYEIGNFIQRLFGLINEKNIDKWWEWAEKRGYHTLSQIFLSGVLNKVYLEELKRISS